MRGMWRWTTLSGSFRGVREEERVVAHARDKRRERKISESQRSGTAG
jgi:hypothetical protein